MVQNVKVEIPPRFVVIDTDPRTIKERSRNDQGTIRGASSSGRGLWEAPKIKAKTIKNNDLTAGEREDLTRPGPRPGEFVVNITHLSSR